MAIVRSFGSVQALTASNYTPTTYTSGSLSLYGQSATYAQLWRTQPNIRTCVDFLARNVAQLGVHVFRRVSDRDRERLAQHPLANLLYAPNPWTTRYRLIEGLMTDLGIYLNAFWAKVRGARLGLMRLPPEQVSVVGTLYPEAYVYALPNGETREFAPADVVHFRSGPGIVGVSPLETLRRILAEEHAASMYREGFWRNSARIDGIISRPAGAPKWGREQADRFRDQWNARFTGGMNSGKTAILEDGMTFTPTAFNARDSEFVASRKLTREECAAAYHIPLPMVGILDHATFSNIREQHKQLYVDCLGPWLECISEDIEAQILPEFDDTDRVYVEFNIAEKLKGSFEEQASALQTSVGKPWMTVNEARAMQNLPAVEGGDELAAPLNMTTAAAQAAGTEPPAAEARPAPQSAAAQAWRRTVEAFWQRQQARIEKFPVADRPVFFDSERWNRELAADLTPLAGVEVALQAAEQINADTWTLLLALRPAFTADRDDHYPTRMEACA